MILIFRCLARKRPQWSWQQQSCRTFVDAKITWVRDRALDHSVEKEKNLRSMLALKNLIKSEPSKSLPVSVAAENKERLFLPFRAIEFIRRYPSIFEEFRPSGGSVLPHVRLTPEVLSLDEDEQLIYDNPDHRQSAADRLLKLLMLTRVNKLPLHIIDRLRWDLGLPPDYVRTLVPDYPDYFQVTSVTSDTSRGSEVLALELVCWIDELAVSAMEKRAVAEANPPYRKGMPLAFPLQFSRGFDMEKKVKSWVNEWQKLPYISPYENALHLQRRSDQAEKWTVSVLHELLHILVSKKTDRDNILCLGEQLGLRSRFKSALINHPGIFYLSNKIRTHTVVLREAFKRDLMVVKHPLMGMRYQYIHLMNKGRDQLKPVGTSDGSRQQARKTGATEGDDESEEEHHEESYGSSCSEAEDVSDDDYVDDDEEDEEDEDENEPAAHGSVVLGRERMIRNPHIELKRPLRSSVRESSVGGYSNRRGDERPLRSSDRESSVGGYSSRRGDTRPLRSSVRESSVGGYSNSRGDKRPLRSSDRESSVGGYSSRRGDTRPLRSSVRESSVGGYSNRRGDKRPLRSSDGESSVGGYSNRRGDKRPLRSSDGESSVGGYSNRRGETRPLRSSDRESSVGGYSNRRGETRPLRSSVRESSVGGYSNRRGDKKRETISGRTTMYRGHNAGVRS